MHRYNVVRYAKYRTIRLLVHYHFAVPNIDPLELLPEPRVGNTIVPARIRVRYAKVTDRCPRNALLLKGGFGCFRGGRDAELSCAKEGSVRNCTQKYVP